MPHARQHAIQHSQTRTRERRHRLAHEAAKIIAQGGTRDFLQAKQKAAERLGIFDDASLPRNREIEEALREYQRLFVPGQDDALRLRREAAVDALQFFRAFQPRLVGAVLDGTADSRSPVTLHVHTDENEAVDRLLSQNGMAYDVRSRRIRLDRHRDADVSCYVFEADGLRFEVLALPYDVVRQAPLSPVDEKPMKRANLAQLEGMLTEAEIADYLR